MRWSGILYCLTSGVSQGAALPHHKEPAEVVQTPDKDVPWLMFIGGDDLGHAGRIISLGWSDSD